MGRDCKGDRLIVKRDNEKEGKEIEGSRVTHYGERDKPQAGGFAKKDVVWYMNNLKTVWRKGTLEDLVLLKGEDHPHIRVREFDEKEGDTEHFHYSFDSKAKVSQLLLHENLRCENPDLNDILRMQNPTLLGITKCIGQRLTGSEVDQKKALDRRDYSKHRQYTWLGNVIVSVNPFHNMPYNNIAKIPDHIKQNGINQEPHVWDTVRRAFAAVFPRGQGQKGKSQTIILSGASGSGKFETSHPPSDVLAINTQHDVHP